jgi:hypothetical protein
MFEKKDKCLKKEMSIKYMMVHGVQVGGRYGQTWNNFWNIRTSLRVVQPEKDTFGVKRTMVENKLMQMAKSAAAATRCLIIDYHDCRAQPHRCSAK